MGKRGFLGILCALSLSCNVVADPGESYLQEVNSAEWQGAGVGGVIGGLFAGPPGIVVGLAGGALFGRHNALEKALQQSIDKQRLSNRTISDLETEVQGMGFRLQREQEIRLNRLKALSSGVSVAIHFRSASAMLEPRYERDLDRLVNTLRAMPELKIHIDAFADVRGSNKFNIDLTERRALVVQRHLIARGIKRQRVVQVPHGEAGAEYPSTDAEGMGLDRRVLLFFSMNET